MSPAVLLLVGGAALLLASQKKKKAGTPSGGSDTPANGGSGPKQNGGDLGPSNGGLGPSNGAPAPAGQPIVVVGAENVSDFYDLLPSQELVIVLGDKMGPYAWEAAASTASGDIGISIEMEDGGAPPELPDADYARTFRIQHTGGFGTAVVSFNHVNAVTKEKDAFFDVVVRVQA